MTKEKLEDIPAQSPDEIVGQFRVVHKRALSVAIQGTGLWLYDGPGDRKLYAIDSRYWFADFGLPPIDDCSVFGSKDDYQGMERLVVCVCHDLCPASCRVSS
jgi:hypothetical protein